MRYPDVSNFLNHWFFILPFAGNWNYENPKLWSLTNPQCGGKLQSPIALDTRNSYFRKNLQLEFFNYRKPLSAPVEIINNGYSAEVGLRVNEDGSTPFLTIGEFPDFFEVQALHFHWGSDGIQGSEHIINGQRYDIEMHIVHKNSKYSTVEEAREYPDGFVVLGVLFQGVPESEGHRTLNELFTALGSIKTYNATAELRGPITMESFIPNLSPNEYFTYRGSLTTPPCSEAVIWYVFSDILPISYKDLVKFWNLVNADGEPILNNFRPIQRSNRPIYRQQSRLQFNTK
ncbi:carbonic anhydrase 1-like [Eupeodes corollae]|uniref:carbonic anhydrase 1-like n=1 Tax=Eupeodes corollae TaxID=290404 RepID=UPI0024904E48|nr:carbonic anhydrase 1-like [Eupeodes corollae]